MELKINSDSLEASAQRFATKGNDIENYVKDIVSKMRALTQIWEGKAQESYLMQAETLQTKIESINEGIQKQSNKLTKMSTTYANREETAISKSGDDLNANAIS